MEKTISKDGTEISYEKRGNGPALLLVDGALCSRAFGPMPKFAAVLENHYTVYTYDRRGRNRSGDKKPYAVERELEDIEALISETGEQAHVLGISSGAALAMAAAASGLAIRKLAMYEPPFILNKEGHHPPADAKERLQQLVDAGRRSSAVKFFMHDMVGMPSFVVALIRLMPIWSKLKAAAHTLPYDATIMGDFSLPEKKAAGLRVPTLVGGGLKSPASMQEAMKALAEHIPNAKLIMLKGQTHNVSATALSPALIEFFEN
jgi:pimeloyl-ACP methyl ester carboxylesterase